MNTFFDSQEVGRILIARAEQDMAVFKKIGHKLAPHLLQVHFRPDRKILITRENDRSVETAEDAVEYSVYDKGMGYSITLFYTVARDEGGLFVKPLVRFEIWSKKGEWITGEASGNEVKFTATPKPQGA